MNFMTALKEKARKWVERDRDDLERNAYLQGIEDAISALVLELFTLDAYEEIVEILFPDDE